MAGQSSRPRGAAGSRTATWRRAASVGGVVAGLAIPALPAAAATGVSTGARVSTAASPRAAGGRQLRAWGFNDHGQLGDDSVALRHRPVPIRLPSGVTITSVRSGCAFTLALTSAGRVLAWGDNSSGQLGDGSTIGTRTPIAVRLPPGTTVTAIRAGCKHAIALTSTGEVLAWGRGDFGQLGNGRAADSTIAVRVALPIRTKATAISAGEDYSLALTRSGQVLAWGRDNLGQLGDGDLANQLSPVHVGIPAGTRVTSIAAGSEHGLAVTRSGQVLAWGDDTFGELGDGNSGATSETPVPAMLPTGTKARSVSGGCGDSVAMTTTGQAVAWGFNNHGQLGIGGKSDTAFPARVRLPRGAKLASVSAACFHTLAVTAASRVLAWGANGEGELGASDPVDHPTSVRVRFPGLVVVAIGTGPSSSSSFAIVRKG
jgi:alpha-tubulin suppressor-like RCC1 family protein